MFHSVESLERVVRTCHVLLECVFIPIILDIDRVYCVAFGIRVNKMWVEKVKSDFQESSSISLSVWSAVRLPSCDSR